MRPSSSALKSSFLVFYEPFIDHCRAVKLGTTENTYTVNNIIFGYTKCGCLSFAHKLFDEMSQRDTVSWNSMIAGYVNSGHFGVAWDLLNDMRRHGFMVDGHTFGSILKGVGCIGRLDIGEQLHSIIMKMGCHTNVFAGSALLDMYAKCRRVEEAYMVFQAMLERNSVSWNALIAGYVEEGDSKAAFDLFSCMEDEGLKIDDGTVTPLLTLLDDPQFYDLNMQLHGKIIKHGLGLNNTVSNAITTSYSECGSLEDAAKVFGDAVGIHDLVTWNSILAAYLVHNEVRFALQLYVKMQESGFVPDIYTYTSLISACFEEAYENLGKSLHGLVIKRGLERSTAISNSLIAMYLKSNGNSMKDALVLFESLEWKDSVSWNSLLTGFSSFGLGEDALKFFGHMQSLNVAIDHYSFSAVLRACSDLATLQLGQQFHVLAIKLGWQQNEHVTSSLIFMYSKCGMIECARKSFEDAPKDSSITWNPIIFGYAQHGQGKVALQLFDQMSEARVKVDHITFVAVLTACSHIGLVEEGRHFLKSMKSVYGVPLRMEHYACGIDLFGRAGLLDEAKELFESMPFKPNAMVLITLLGACRNCGDVQLASQVASHLLELEPEEHSTYVLLSDMYGRLKRWDEKASLTKLMRERGVKKVPGWSWIEINNKVHAFGAEDCSHPDCQEIYHVLRGLMEEIRLLNGVSHNQFEITSFSHQG